MPDGINIKAKHGGPVEVRAVPVREPDGRITVTAPATDNMLQAYANGSRNMSVEVRVRKHNFTEYSKIREVTSAFLEGVAMEKSPEYSQTALEIRQGGFSLRSVIQSGVKLACDCQGVDCRYAEFSDGSLDIMLQFINDADDGLRPIPVGFDTFRRNRLGSASSGSLRANRVDDGLELEVDVPDNDAGHLLSEALATGPVLMRPYIDRIDSEFTKQGDVAVYDDQLVLRGILLEVTDRVEGWQPVEVVEPRGLVVPDVHPLTARIRRQLAW